MKMNDVIVFEIIKDGNYFIIKTNNSNYKHLNDRCCNILLYSAMNNIADIINNDYNKGVCFTIG